MTATYTFDVFSSLDGYGSYNSSGDWGGCWGKQCPERPRSVRALAWQASDGGSRFAR